MTHILSTSTSPKDYVFSLIAQDAHWCLKVIMGSSKILMRFQEARKRHCLTLFMSNYYITIEKVRKVNSIKWNISPSVASPCFTFIIPTVIQDIQ